MSSTTTEPAGARTGGRLEGRVALVTGGAQGIGRALAEGMRAEGAQVAVADLRGAEEAGEQMGGLGVTVDVSSEADTARMAEAVVERFGKIDVLVNNAGIFTSLVPKPFEELDVDEWRKVYDVNVMGMWLATKAVSPHMRAAGSGRVINLSSGTPFKGVPFMLHYVSSKGAVLAMTKALAKELGKDGVLVNCIAPGYTMSDGAVANDVQVQALQEVSVKARTLVRDQYPADIVGAAVFFASDEASFITGQTLVVDGGAYFH